MCWYDGLRWVGLGEEKVTRVHLCDVHTAYVQTQSQIYELHVNST